MVDTDVLKMVFFFSSCRYFVKEKELTLTNNKQQGPFYGSDEVNVWKGEPDLFTWT
jgi:hypothetical protein